MRRNDRSDSAALTRPMRELVRFNEARSASTIAQKASLSFCRAPGGANTAASASTASVAAPLLACSAANSARVRLPGRGSP